MSVRWRKSSNPKAYPRQKLQIQVPHTILLYNKKPKTGIQRQWYTITILSRSIFFQEVFLFCNALFRHPYIETEKDIAVRNYNARLAKIFEIEEYIMGMTINMTDFQL